MNLRRWLYLSLAANVGLLGLFTIRPASRSSAQPPEETKPAAEVIEVAQAPRPLPPPGNLESARAEFHWSRIASDDLKQLANNLRAIGCPAQSLEIIFQALLQDSVRDRIWAVVQELDPTFCETLAKTTSISDLAKPQQEKIEAVAKEEESLRESLRLQGRYSPPPELDRLRRAAELSDFLSAEQSARAIEMEEHFQEREGAAGQNSKNKAERERVIQDLKRERLESLGHILSPDQAAELDLRRRAQGSIRVERATFPASRREWEVLIDIQRQAQFTNANPLQLEHAMAGFLGPERAAEFKLHGEERFRDFLELAEDSGRSAQAAKLAHEATATAQQEREAIRKERVPEYYRLELEQAWQKRTLAALTGFLGEECVAAYLSSKGDWLQVEQ